MIAPVSIGFHLYQLLSSIPSLQDCQQQQERKDSQCTHRSNLHYQTKCLQSHILS